MSGDPIATASAHTTVHLAAPLVPSPVAPHAVARLRAARAARSTRPFLARGGPKGVRCEGCRLRPSHCLCALRPMLASHAGVCLLMHDAEPLKPSNTGWLIADVVQDTWAFGWSRTAPDAALLALLQDPQWQPYVVFPADGIAPERVVHSVPGAGVDGALDAPSTDRPTDHPSKRPLLVLLDATWTEARKMFRKSPYLDALPVLSLEPGVTSRYRLRHAPGESDRFCTAEVAAMCLGQCGDAAVGEVLASYLDVYTHHYLQAKHQLPPDTGSAAYAGLHTALAQRPAVAPQRSGA